MSGPEGWSEACVGEFTVPKVEQSAPDKEVSYIDIGSIDRERKVIGPLGVVNGSSAPTRARQWVRAGDVLVSMTRPNLNAVALVGESLSGCVASTGFDVLRSLGVLPEWIFARVRSQAFINDVCKDVQGVVYPAIRPDDVRGHRMPIPPLAEQRRIVDALESHDTRLDAAIESLRRVDHRLKAYRASVLKAAVEGRLVPTEDAEAKKQKRPYEPASVLLDRILRERRYRWEEAELARLKKAGKEPKNDNWKARYVEPEQPATSGLPTLPEGWCWAALPQLGEVSRGKSKHRPRNDPRLLGGPFPFVQTGDVRKADTWLREFTETYSDFGLAQSRLWPKGTLCITIAANIAETAILTFDACFPDSVVGFLSADATLTRYVELFFRTARQRLEQYAPATAQKNINLETLSNIAVPLPPAAEQARIVEQSDRLLSIAASCERSVATGQIRAGRLRQSVLKWAFEGKLVEQEPTDEPAEKLLARIRAESGTTTTSTKPKNGKERLAG